MLTKRHVVGAGFASVLCLGALIAPATAAQGTAETTTVACFDQHNASVIGRLGATDAGVARAFDAGACLVVSEGTTVQDVTTENGYLRFTLAAGAPALYAPRWGAGLSGMSGYDAGQVATFARYEPVTASLLADGHAYASCYAEAEKLVAAFADFDKRWEDYRQMSNPPPGRAMMVDVTYATPRGPALIAEYAQLLKDEHAMNARCAAFDTFEADANFQRFLLAQAA